MNATNANSNDADAQLEELSKISGEGPVVPDGWTRGYNEETIPVLNQTPIMLIEDLRPIEGGQEGVEWWERYDVGEYLVTVFGAFAHPGNVSKVKVEEKSA
ncbi:hypothetical protein [Halorubrum ezzemoulense]|uniref:hypothetical protein n=1 Tax=Halorubrum ezzemoulense TaxID=337243 RepID=UPI00232B23F3|nr:hypothetical protein [Halorubrum ezzemoulense]MDB2237070.1 hypothetical protein [Halorubrum ezzemoulense]